MSNVTVPIEARRPRRRLPARLWSARWPTVRLLVAACLLSVMVSDNPARLSRAQLAHLPDYDYAREMRFLRGQGRFGEALVVAESGLAELTGWRYEALARERDATLAERDSKWRKLRQLGVGAIVGQGDSIAELVGAVSADMLVIGDVRDLLIQGSRFAVDGETDELIVALSALGLATTVAPQVDWAASLLKIARKAGALTEQMSRAVLAMVRAASTGHPAGWARLTEDLAVLGRKASPAGAVRILRHADNPRDLERLADFVKRERAGAFALHVSGREGAALVTTSGPDAVRALTAAAKKGDRGLAWLRSGNGRLLRPHPVVGLLKTAYKGTAPRLIQRMVNEYLDPYGLLLILVLGAWTFAETALIYRRLTA